MGEHRRAELIAIGVKDELQNDAEVAAEVPFIEFELYEIDDYIEVLYRKKEAIEKGLTEEEFDEKKDREMHQRVIDYEKSLRARYGPLLFNLHESKRSHVRYDVQFRITDHIKENRRFGNYLDNISRQHEIRLELLYGNSDPFASCGLLLENVVVEFATPQPEELLIWPSEEIRKLANKYAVAPRNTPPSNFPFFLIPYKVADTKNPLYKETVGRYSSFMKDVVLGLKELKLK